MILAFTPFGVFELKDEHGADFEIKIGPATTPQVTHLTLDGEPVPLPLPPLDLQDEGRIP